MRSTAALDRILQREQAAATKALKRAWGKVTPTQDFDLAWRDRRRRLTPTLEHHQARVSVAAAVAVPAQLAEQGVYVAPRATINPARFVGINGDGRALTDALDGLPVRARASMADGRSATMGLRSAGALGSTIISTMLADLVRMTLSTSITTRPTVVWVRHINPPCCDRCAILAGKVFRFNEGFLRHPGCDCHHVATVNRDGLAGAQTTDPYEYFESLTPAQQDHYFGAANAQAIRDGADIYQVVNARRGMANAGARYTSEGTTRRGYWRQNVAVNDRQWRLTPQGVYDMAGGDRERALDLLERAGYILPGGQTPGGSLQGIVFDPRTTMTAAQRRVLDAQWRLDEVRAGRNPYTVPAMERRWGMRSSGATDYPLTPQIAASVEQYSTLMIAANGEMTTYREYVRLTQALLLPAP